MSTMSTTRIAINSFKLLRKCLKTKTKKVVTVRDLPGPKPSLPVIGTGWQYYRFVGNYDIRSLHNALIDKFNKYGSIFKEEYQRNKPIVYISDPKDIEIVFRAQGKCPIRPPNEFVVHYRSQHKDKYPSVGIVNLNGQEWYENRQVLGPALLKMDVIQNYIQNLDIVCKDFVKYVDKQKTLDNETNDYVIEDFRDISYNYVFESISLWCLNRRIGCLDLNQCSSVVTDGPILISATKSLFESYQKLFYSTKLWKYFKTKAYRQLEDSENAIYETLSKYVDSVISSATDSSDGLINELFQLKSLSANQIKVILMDFIVGGLFTVSNALNFVCHHLATNADVQQKLYQEIKEVMNDTTDITVDSLSRMPFLKACIKESFRLTPTTPGIVRILPTDVCLSGYYIPRGLSMEGMQSLCKNLSHSFDLGTLIFANSMATCLSDQYFERPNAYIPERWIGDGRHEFHPFLVLPFGFGSRMCVGKHFALLHIQMAIVSLIRRYELTVEKGEQIDSICDFLIIPNRELKIHLKNRL